MRHLIRFGCGAVLAFGTISMSCSHAQNLAKADVTSTMRFELISGFLVVVDGQIGNLNGFRFILDTGATHSLIDRKVADRLHLERRHGDVMNFDRLIPIEWADIPELRVGPLRAEELPVMVIKLAEYSELAQRADGIIGLDLLSHAKKFIISYDKNIASLEPTADRTREHTTPSCFVVPVVVQGHKMHLAVDTGMQGIVLYKTRLREQIPKMRIEGEPTNLKMGRLRATQIRLPGVQLGGADIVATVILIDGPSGVALPGVDGYLGPASLHLKRIEFDFDAGVLRWQ